MVCFPMERRIPQCYWDQLTLQLAHPEFRVSYVSTVAMARSLPGFLAPQSAHRLFPGTVFMSS